MRAAPQIYVSPESVADRLDELGLLKRESWTEVVKEGTALALGCTLNDPAGFAALSAWAKITRALRERSVPDRARRTNIQNQPATLFNSGISVVVRSGDENTGLNDGTDPATRSDKGVVMQAAIRAGEGASAFDDAEQGHDAFTKFINAARARIFARSVQAYAGTTTYILLYYIDTKLGEIRFELSRPKANNQEAVISSWTERILFESIKIDAGTVIVVDDVDPAHQVVVSRKA